VRKGRREGGREEKISGGRKEGGRKGGRATYQVRDVGQGEAGGVPQLVAEVAVAHHTLNV